MHILSTRTEILSECRSFLNSSGFEEVIAVASSNLLATYVPSHTITFSNGSSQINTNYLSINTNP